MLETEIEADRWKVFSQSGQGRRGGGGLTTDNVRVVETTTFKHVPEQPALWPDTRGMRIARSKDWAHCPWLIQVPERSAKPADGSSQFACDASGESNMS